MTADGFRAAGQARPLRLLTVAELSWRNGHEYAMQAARLLRQQNVPFEYRIVGRGDFLEAVAFARYELGLVDRVVILTDVPASQYKQHFDWADLFVLSAVAEGAGHALGEACRRGLTTIHTDAPGLVCGEACGGNDFVVPRRNPRSLAERIKAFAAQLTPERATGVSTRSSAGGVCE